MLRDGSGGVGRVVDVATGGADNDGAVHTTGDGGAMGRTRDGDAVRSKTGTANAADTVDGRDAECMGAHGPSPRRDQHGPSHPPAEPETPMLLSLPRLSREALAGLGRGDLLSVLGDVERLVNQAAGYRVQVLGALDALSRSGTAPDASPHLTLRDAAGVSEREARRMTRAAQKTREHGMVLKALYEGEINPAQAEALCDARVPDWVRENLIGAAVAEDTDATRRRVRHAETEHCVETSMERFERQRQARGAGWQRDHEGMLKLWAKLDPHTGAQIEAMLEPLRREFWSDDKQVRSGRRSPAQRDADVLAYALAGIASTDADDAAVDRLHARARRQGRTPDRDEPRPSQRTTPLENTAKPDQFDTVRSTPDGSARRQRESAAKPAAAHRKRSSRNQPDAASQDGRCCCSADRNQGDSCWCDAEPGKDSTSRSLPDADHVGWEGLGDRWDPARRLPPAQISVLIGLDALRGHTDKTGLTDAGTELPPETVRQLACDAEVIPIVLGSPGGPADIGRASRTVPLRLRRLLVARDRHCRWPGCAVPPSRCDAHHIIHWLSGGPTDLDNLVLLCHRHHHHLHKHGCRIVLEGDGCVTVDQEPESAPPVGTAQPRGP